MTITYCLGMYFAMMRDKTVCPLGGGWYASGKTREEAMTKCLETAGYFTK